MTDSTREMVEQLGDYCYCADLAGATCHPCRAAALLTQQAERIAELKDENACDVCAGTGTPTSGKPCICAGTGKASQAFMQLRIDYYDLESRLAAAEARAERAEKDAGRYRWLRSDESDWHEYGLITDNAHQIDKYLDETIDAAIDAAKEQGNG